MPNYDEYNDDNVQTGGSNAAGQLYVNTKVKQPTPIPEQIPAPEQVPVPVQANLQDNSLRYIGVNQKELETHITIDDAGNIKTTNVQQVYKHFKTLLDSIKKIKEIATRHLKTSENLRDIDNNSYYEIIKKHLNDNNNFKSVSHKLDFKCYKDTLTEINVSSNETDKEKITQYIAIAFAEHDTTTFHSIPDTTPNIVNYFRREDTAATNNEKWNNIPSSEERKTKLHTVSQPTSIATTDTVSVYEIQTYINTCDIHQTSYNEKHNELIKLFNVLQIILRNITELIEIINKISSIKPVNSKSTIAKLLIKIPKTLVHILHLDDLQNLTTELKPSLNKINPVPETVVGGGDYNNMHGGAAQSADSANKFFINITPDNDKTYSLTIPDDNKEHFKYAKTIHITQGEKFVFEVELNGLIIDKKLTLILKPQKKIVGFNIETFNKLDQHSQLSSINIVTLGINHKYTAGIMQSIAHATTSILKNSIIHATTGTTFDEVVITNNVPEESIAFTAGNKQRIETILLRCYDLQALYLIKYFEIIALIKYIIYFCNIFIDCICVCNFIISLYEVINIDLETLPAHLNTKTIVNDLNKMLTTHTEIQKLMENNSSGDISVGGAASNADMVVGLSKGGTLLKGGATAPGTVQNVVKSSSLADSINLICSEIYFYDINSDSSTETLHDLYIKLYNVIPTIEKTKLNNINSNMATFNTDVNTLSNAELLSIYSVLHEKYVIPYIIKNFNTHSQTSNMDIDGNVETNVLIQKMKAFSIYFARFDCKPRMIECKNITDFKPTNVIDAINGSIHNLLTNKPFYFKLQNIDAITNNKYFEFEIYKLLFNAARAGFSNNMTLNYDLMKKSVNIQTQVGETVNNTVVRTNVPNVKQEVLQIINAAEEAVKKVAVVQHYGGGSITNYNLQNKTKKNIKKFDFSKLYETKNKDKKHKSFTIKKKYNRHIRK